MERVIMGSAIVNIYSKHIEGKFDSGKVLGEIGEFAREMKEGLGKKS